MKKITLFTLSILFVTNLSSQIFRTTLQDKTNVLNLTKYAANTAVTESVKLRVIDNPNFSVSSDNIFGYNTDINTIATSPLIYGNNISITKHPQNNYTFGYNSSTFLQSGAGGDTYGVRAIINKQNASTVINTNSVGFAIYGELNQDLNDLPNYYAGYFGGKILVKGDIVTDNGTYIIQPEEESTTNITDLTKKLDKISVHKNTSQRKASNTNAYVFDTKELKKQFPELTKEVMIVDSESQSKSMKKQIAINYTSFIPLLVGAHSTQAEKIQESQNEIQELKSSIEELEKQIEALKDLINKDNSFNSKKDKNLGAINVFPNPANEIFTVGIDSESHDEISISAYNSEGRVIATLNDNIYKGNNYIDVECSNWTSGTYVLKISTGNDVEVARKISVQ